MAATRSPEQKLRFWQRLVLIEVAVAAISLVWLAPRASLPSMGASKLRSSSARLLDSLCRLEQPLPYSTLLACRTALDDPYGTRPEPPKVEPAGTSAVGGSLTPAGGSNHRDVPAPDAPDSEALRHSEPDGDFLGAVLLPHFEYELHRIPPDGEGGTAPTKRPPEYELVGRWRARKYTAPSPALESANQERIEAWKHAYSYRRLFLHSTPALERATRVGWRATLSAWEQEQVERGLSSIDSALARRWGERVGWLEARMPYAIYREGGTEYRVHGYSRESDEEGQTIYHLQVRIAPVRDAGTPR